MMKSQSASRARSVTSSIFFKRGRLVFGTDLVLRNLTIQILRDCRQPALQKPLLHIAQNYGIPVARKDVCNAVAHGSRADYSNPLHIHGIYLPPGASRLYFGPKLGSHRSTERLYSR